ncbi:hypothetical protein AMS68_005131 [Peltaster fructicola]|uniref:JmjC domain-containing histone demethylation protein 1 n=1 Tax=Peltaster fructicola TaxID=286661 RepID=A0A6H0XY05_9PEZI|nr:hypothetical protein AMS68_005131 [Peltaster fructicola]
MYTFYNMHFKPPAAQSQQPQRSPSPPHSYIEPLSPSAVRPRPIEPNFYYPALSSNNNGSSGSSQYGTQQESHGRKRGHHRVSSSIDTLADAALAINSGFDSRMNAPRYDSARALQYSYQDGEPPHKRTRSEVYPAPFIESQTRPLTSYNAWSYISSQGPTHTTYNTRVEEAALLLNFSVGGKPPTFRHAHSDPVQQQNSHRPHANSLPSQTMHGSYHHGIYAPAPQSYDYSPQRPTLPSPERTSESKGPTPEALGEQVRDDAFVHPRPQHTYSGKSSFAQPQQIHTPPEEMDFHAHNSTSNAPAVLTIPPKKRGWPKGKPRGPNEAKAASDAINVEPALKKRRHSLSDSMAIPATTLAQSRHASAPPMLAATQQYKPAPKPRRQPKPKEITVCAGCSNQRISTVAVGEQEEWISCNGCKRWYHLDCAGFARAADVRDVDKYFCSPCEITFGKTTYVRKSSRAHASVDYAELQKGVLKTSEESTEHHYIQPIKDGTLTFDPDHFPRIRPELLTRELFEKSGTFAEPIVIPGEWNPRPWAREKASSATEPDEETQSDDIIDDANYEYDCVMDDGQDKLDMVMPKGLTVRKVCNLVGAATPLDVIDVKTQNSGGQKWDLGRWADYYESQSETKTVRNVISLEVSHTKLGRLLRRPKIVRDIDLQDHVWPQEEIEKGKWPKVQYYCLMSIADSYTDFHIDFGGSSVYYHVLQGKKTFFFIPPRPRHLKTYEEWNENPAQNFTFLPKLTNECYRVDLKEGDTMLIPSGWIHAVWTPETSLVIGGNFLTHMNFKNQFKVAEIEKNNETPMKFRYPFFQRLMWYTAIHYMQSDPMPEEIYQLFREGQQYERERPLWQDFDADMEYGDRPGSASVRYYSEAELDGLPDLVNFLFRTVMMSMGKVEGITSDRVKRVHASIPKGHGDPLEVAQAFALWVAWKRGNESPPAWAQSEAIVAISKEQGIPQKLSARAIKDLEKKEAAAGGKISKTTKKSHRHSQLASMSSASPAPQTDRPADATAHSDATLNFDHANVHATPHQSSSSLPSPHMFLSQPIHQEGIFTPSYDYSPPSAAPATMMMSAFQGQHISTPKTSVLGPKRVACDACRRRRIRCKHKDFVVQAVPDLSMHQLPNGFDSIGASAEGDMMSQAHQEGHHDEDTHDGTVNGLTANGNHNATVKVENGVRPSHGLGTIPGTNAYVDANIPMTLNGVALFGDAKRGRSKACFECRKSKRRCIHDEQGNVDPVKAAETPIPRASPAVRKRHSEDSLNSEGKKVKIASAIPPQAGVLGVLRPANYKRQSPIQSEWSSASPTSDQLVRTPLDASTPNSHASLPIDPSLTSAYPDPGHAHLHDLHYSYSAPARPGLISLPSLEEIATEVLDMDAGERAEAETDLAAIQQFNRLGNATELVGTFSTINFDGAKSVSADKSQEQRTGGTAEISPEQAAHAKKSSVDIPMYKPPPSKSPELTRAKLSGAGLPLTPRSNEERKDGAALTSPLSASKARHTRAASRNSIADETHGAEKTKEEHGVQKGD